MILIILSILIFLVVHTTLETCDVRHSVTQSLTESVSHTFVTIWKNENIFKTFKPNIFKTFKPNIFGGKYFQNIKKTQKNAKMPHFSKKHTFFEKNAKCPIFREKNILFTKKTQKSPIFRKNLLFSEKCPIFRKKHTFLFSLTLVTREN